jgi:DNA primase
LRRYASRVVLLFDGDKAGRKAVRSAAPLLSRAGLGARVVSLAAGEDPDSYLRAHGPDGLRALVDAAPGMIEHLIDDAASEAGGDASAKAAAIEALGPVLASVESPIEAQICVERVARKFGIGNLGAVREQLRRGVRAARAGERRPRPEAPAPEPEPETPALPGGTPLPALETDLLGALLDAPELFSAEASKNLENLLTSRDLRAIFLHAARMVGMRGAVDVAALIAAAESMVARSWLEERLAIQKYDAEGARVALDEGARRLAEQHSRREVSSLSEAILRARREGRHEQAEELTRERHTLAASVATRGAREVRDEPSAPVRAEQLDHSRGDDGDE